MSWLALAIVFAVVAIVVIADRCNTEPIDNERSALVSVLVFVLVFFVVFGGLFLAHEQKRYKRLKRDYNHVLNKYALVQGERVQFIGRVRAAVEDAGQREALGLA